MFSFREHRSANLVKLELCISDIEMWFRNVLHCSSVTHARACTLFCFS